MVAAAISRWLGRLSPGWVVFLFTVVNMLNYLDRGIVPGAYDSLDGFIRTDLAVNGTDTYQGLLTSSYIVGYATASVSFGHLTHAYSPFKLVATGLSIWLISVVVSGAAPHYWVLILGRVFSGAGEASFQTVVPPYIDNFAPPHKRGLWLAIFFSAIPVGTAAGYVWGGNVASALSWRAAFFLEAAPMAPLLILVWLLPYPGRDGHPLPHPHGHSDGALTGATVGSAEKAGSDRDALLGAEGSSATATAGGAGAAGRMASTPGSARRGEGSGSGSALRLDPSSASKAKRAAAAAGLDGLVAAALEDGYVPPGGRALDAAFERAGAEAGGGTGTAALVAAASSGSAGAYGLPSGGGDGEGHAKPQAPSFMEELLSVMLNPIFQCAVLGYAGYTAVMAGVGNFGPKFVEGLGIFHDQASSSTYFGGAVALAGAIGTPLGGWLLDWATDRAQRRKRRQAKGGLVASAFSAGGGTAADGDATSLLRSAEAGAASPLSPISPALGVTPRAEPPSEEELAELEASATDPAVLELKLLIALPQAVWLTILGFAGCLGGVLLGTESGMAFFALLGIGALCLTATTAGVNLAIMAAVDPGSRSFAIGLATLLTHALGDVPAPPIIGALADALSPQTCDADGNCTRPAKGLQETLVLSMLWLVWPVLLWFAGWYLSRRAAAARKAREEAEALALSSSGVGGAGSREVPDLRPLSTSPAPSPRFSASPAGSARSAGAASGGAASARGASLGLGSADGSSHSRPASSGSSSSRASRMLGGAGGAAAGETSAVGVELMEPSSWPRG